MYESYQVITIGDIVRMLDFFRHMKSIEPWYKFKIHWQYDTALDVLELMYAWIQSGKPEVDFDLIFFDEKNKLKRGKSYE